MVWYEKNKRKAKKKDDTGTVVCDYCGKYHYRQAGGWVVNGNGQLLCYDLEGGCFDKVRGLRTNDFRERHPRAGQETGQVGFFGEDGNG